MNIVHGQGGELFRCWYNHKWFNFEQTEAGRLHMTVFGTLARVLAPSERERRRRELIRVDLRAPRSFPFSNPLQRWNEKRGRADLCVTAVQRGLPCFTGEGASAGMHSLSRRRTRQTENYWKKRDCRKMATRHTWAFQHERESAISRPVHPGVARIGFQNMREALTTPLMPTAGSPGQHTT